LGDMGRGLRAARRAAAMSDKGAGAPDRPVVAATDHPAPMVWTRTSDERRGRQVSWLAGRWSFAHAFPVSQWRRPLLGGERAEGLAAHSCGHSRGLGETNPRTAFPLGRRLGRTALARVIRRPLQPRKR